MTHLIDSDWFIDALAGIPEALALLAQFPKDHAAVSIISVGEVYDGAYGAYAPAVQVPRAQQFLANYPFVPLDERVMQQFAQTRIDLRRRGLLIGDLDIAIAATAIVNKLTLVTRNTRHFGRVAGLALYGQI